MKNEYALHLMCNMRNMTAIFINKYFFMEMSMQILIGHVNLYHNTLNLSVCYFPCK